MFIEHLLYARYCPKYNSPPSSGICIIIIIPFLYMEKPRYRVLKLCARDHNWSTAEQDLNPDTLSQIITPV